MKTKLCLAVGLLLICVDAMAIGPLVVVDGGKPVKWPNSLSIPLDLENDVVVDQNPGFNKDISGLVDNALGEWEGVNEASVVFSLQSLGASVNGSNVCDFFCDQVICPSGPCDDGENPLVIDENGDIIAKFFGEKNRFVVLGFASVPNFNLDTGEAIKGQAVFSAVCLQGTGTLDAACAGGFTDDDFESFIVHEMGHFLGLDHSQVNLEEATDFDDSDDNLITTMFPLFIRGNGANFKTPERDDRVGLAQLYPASGFFSSTWSLEGFVFDSSGNNELQCANLVARNVDNPRVDAISALSGDFGIVDSEDGAYQILGLNPGASYTIDVEQIGPPNFINASGYTPCRGGFSGQPPPPSFSAFTSSSSFSAAAGATLNIDCRVEDDCDAGSGGGGGGSGGCSLVR